MSGRSSFVLYISQRKHLKLLNQVQKGDLLDAIFAHAAGEDPPEVDGMTMMALSFISDQMDRDHEKYLETSRKRSEAGKMGGRPKATTSTDKQPEANKANAFSDKQTETKKPDNDNVNDTDNDTDKDNNVGKDPTPPMSKAKKTEYPYKDVIAYLNEKAGSSFRATSKDTRKHIGARFAEGHTLEDFKRVIDKKVSAWMGTEWEKYLRPVTLFGTKFEAYLNEKPKGGKQSGPEQRTGPDAGGLVSEAIAAGVSTEFEGW